MGCVVNGPGEAREADLGHRRRATRDTCSSRARSSASSPRTRWSRRSWPRPSSWWPRGSRPGRPRRRRCRGRGRGGPARPARGPRGPTPTPRRPKWTSSARNTATRVIAALQRRHTKRATYAAAVGSPTMRMSRLLLRTLRQAPADAEVASHQLLVRGGLHPPAGLGGVHLHAPRAPGAPQVGAGHERSSIGRDARRCSSPRSTPGAVGAERAGRVLRLRRLARLHRRGPGWHLRAGPTHEEVATTTVGAEVDSYRQLPLTIYQIQVNSATRPGPGSGCFAPAS